MKSIAIILVLLFMVGCNGKTPAEDCYEKRIDFRNPSALDTNNIMAATSFHISEYGIDSLKIIDDKGNDVTKEYMNQMIPVYNRLKKETKTAPPTSGDEEVYKVFEAFHVSKFELEYSSNKSYEKTLMPCE